jgi:outer membrane protein TolC
MVAICSCPVFSGALTLHDAQQLLLHNNLELKAAATEQEKNTAVTAESKALWYPTFDLVGSYSYLTEKSKTEFGRLSFTMPSNDKVEAGFDLTYPVTAALVNINGVKFRHQGERVKDQQNRAIGNQLSFKLGMLYVAWAFSRRQLDIQDTLIGQLDTYLKQVEEQKSAGIVVNARVLDARARLALARVDKLSNQTLFDSLKQEIVSLTDCPFDIEPQALDLGLDSSGWQNQDSVTLDSKRPEFAAFDEAIVQQNVLDLVASGQKYPNLVLLGGWRVASPGLVIGDTTWTNWMNYGILGAQLRWNLFDGRKVHSQRVQARKQGLVFSANRDNLAKQFEKSMSTAKMQIKKALALESAAREAQAAGDALVIDLKNSLDAGVVTSADYLNAAAQRAKAALAVEAAEFQKKSALLQLWFAAGKDLRF